MKACVLEGVGSLIYKEVETPEPKKGEVLLHVKACGICSSDIDRVFTTGTYHFPTIPGHEFSGEIVATGEGVDQEYVGKRAVVFPLVPCMECPSCADENYVHCSSYDYFGSRSDGAFAEYLAVPLWNVIVFPDSIPFTQAALTEPAAVAMHAAKKAEVAPGERVAIIGSGTIGIILALWLRMFGADDVILVGTNDEKLKFIHELGFKNTVNGKREDVAKAIQEATKGQGADIVFECVGSESSLESAILATKKAGKTIIVGNPEGDMTLARDVYWKILRNELTLIGVWNSSYNSKQNDWADVLAALGEGKVDFAPLITHTFSLEEHAQAFETLKDRSQLSIKVMFSND